MAVECGNIQNLPIQDGGRPPFWKLLYWHIAVNEILYVKANQDNNETEIPVSKIQIFKLKMAVGRHIGKHQFRP